MISRIGYNPNSQPSFGGITKIKVLFDEAVTYDPKIIDRAIRIAKKIYMKKPTIPPNEEWGDKVRKTLKYFDNDYVIPAAPVKGDTRHFFTHVESNGQHFFVTGQDANNLDRAGYKIGHTKKAAKLAQGTEAEEARRLDHEWARSEYGDDISGIQQKFTRSPNHTEMAIFTGKNKNGKIGISLIRVGNDTHKLNINEIVTYIKAQKAKLEAEKLAKLKPQQTDFMDKLFSKNA